MNKEFREALEQLGKERGIGREVLISAIEAALLSAYKKNFGSGGKVTARIEESTGELKVLAIKKVVEKVRDVNREISLEEARKINPNCQLEEEIEVEVMGGEFGRIAAQTAKQVVVQRIREAERELVYEEYKDRQGDILTGTVQRWEQNSVIIDLGRAEAILPTREQVGGETYRQGDRLKLYVLEVKKTTKGPQIIVSRTHPGLLRRLFELEVPEISQGLVEIKAVAREAGMRSKIAVSSRDKDVDPVGACVGAKGVRVQAVVRELNGEKIDVITWGEDPVALIANALSPAKVVEVIADKEEKVAKVIVSDQHLSLAIGKKGQNARLAAKLTGWKIDILSESQAQAELKKATEVALSKETITIRDLPGVGEKTAQRLEEKGYTTIEKLFQASLEDLLAVPGIGQKTAEKILAALDELSSEI